MIANKIPEPAIAMTIEKQADEKSPKSSEAVSGSKQIEKVDDFETKDFHAAEEVSITALP